MMLNHPTTSPKSTWGKKKINSTIHCRHAQKHAPMQTPLYHKEMCSSTISKDIFNELRSLSIYQNGIRTALSDSGEQSRENGARGGEKKQSSLKAVEWR